MNLNQTAEQERALRELGDKVGSSVLDASTSTEVEALGKLPSGRYFSLKIYMHIPYLLNLTSSITFML